MSIQPTLPRSAAALAPVFLSALDEDLAFKFFVAEHWTPQAPPPPPPPGGPRPPPPRPPPRP